MVYNDCELVVNLLTLNEMVNYSLPPVCVTREARVMANGQQVYRMPLLSSAKLH